MKTRQGWVDKNEVVEVWYDPKVLAYEELLAFADDNECARQVWTRTAAQLAVATKRLGERARSLQAAVRLDPEQKYYLLQTPLKALPMSEAQASRVNASLKGDWKQYLSPLQRQQAEKLMQAEKLKQAEQTKTSAER